MRHLHSASAAFGGGTDARGIALAIGLGLLAGFVTTPSLTLLAVLLLAVLLNLHTRSFIFAWGAAWALSWPLRPVTRGLGRLLLEDTWCADVLRDWDDSLLPVLLDWHRFTTFGGLVLGSALAVVAFWRVYQALSSIPQDSQGTDAQPSRRVSYEVRICTRLRRLLVHDEPTLVARDRWTRPWGFPAAVVCAGLAALLASWMVPHACRRALVERLTQLNGAEVSVGDIKLDLATGRVAIDDLRLADPAALDHDRWRIGHVEGTFSVGLMARGRLDFKTLSLTSIREHVRRSELARAHGDRALRSAIQALDEPVLLTPSAVEATLGSCEAEIALSTLAHDWTTLAERLEFVRRAIAGAENLHKLEIVSTNDMSEFAPVRGRARLAIRELKATGFARACGFGAKAHLTLKNLSSERAYNTRAVELTLVAPEMATEVRAALRLLEDSPRHELELDIYDLPLARAFHTDGAGRYCTVAGGVADLRASGTCDREGFRLDVQVEARQVDARFHGETPLAGISPAAWNETIRRLNPLRGDFAIEGNWSSPRIVLDEEQLVADVKLQLRAANEQVLVEIIDRQRSRTLAAQRARSTEALAQNSAVETHAVAAPSPLAVESPGSQVEKRAAPVARNAIQRNAYYDRYRSQVAENALRVESEPSSVASENAASEVQQNVQQSTVATTPTAAHERNRLFEQMVPQAPAPQTAADSVCQSCMTQSFEGNNLPPGAAIDAPQVSIEGPTSEAGAIGSAAVAAELHTESLDPSVAEAAISAPPLPEAANEIATPDNVLAATPATTPPVYTPHQAAAPQSGALCGDVSQTVRASATAASAPLPSAADAEAVFLGAETGYADGVAQALPLEGTASFDEMQVEDAPETSSDGFGARARDVGTRVSTWTGGLVSRVKGWWPRRVTEDERAMSSGAGVPLDPWANEPGAQPNLATAKSNPAVSTAPTAATSVGAPETAHITDQASAEPTAGGDVAAEVEGEVEYEARQPKSTWQPLQFWRDKR